MLHKIGRKWHFCLKVGVLPHSTLHVLHFALAPCGKNKEPW